MREEVGQGIPAVPEARMLERRELEKTGGDEHGSRERPRQRPFIAKKVCAAKRHLRARGSTL